MTESSIQEVGPIDPLNTGTGADFIRHGGTLPPLLQKAGQGAPCLENNKQETDQTVLTITKALTKTIRPNYSLLVKTKQEDVFPKQNYIVAKLNNSDNVMSIAVAWKYSLIRANKKVGLRDERKPVYVFLNAKLLSLYMQL